MLVVEVLPWLPATAMLRYGFIKVPSISARGIIVIFDFLAKTNSLFLWAIAEEATTRSAVFISLGSCPICTFAPSFFKSLTSSVKTRSEPEILKPRFCRIVATPIIPEPPIPIM